MSASQRTGDEGLGDVFDEKYESYGKMLYRLCMIYLGNYADVEEVMQEAFIRLLYKAPVFENDRQEKIWLTRVAVNLCKDKLKSFWRKKILPLEGMELRSQEGVIEDRELSELILKLPPKYKAVIHLHYFENYKVEEIAAILRISQSAVKMRLERGREFLRLGLEKEGYII